MIDRWAKPVVRWARRRLCSPSLEHAISQLYAACPVALRPWVMRIGPQVNSYDLSTSRTAARHGYMWRLEPAHYCQWLHYFQYDDVTHRVFLQVAHECRAQYAVDVGANVGIYSLPLARQLEPGGFVIAVEPHPGTFAHLVHHIELNQETRVRPAACALGRQPGIANLFDGRDAGKRSMMRHSADQSSVQVEVKTVDQLMKEQALPRVDLLKIDVEGYEPEVLLGASETLARDRPTIVAELTPSWSGSGLFSEAISSLVDLGYHFYRIGDVSRGSALPIDPESIRSLRETERNWVIRVP